MADVDNPVIWFEIPVRNFDRAIAFYEEVLAIKLSINELGPLQMAWFPMEENGSGAAGALVKGDGYEPSRTGTLVYLSVADIDESLARAEAQGGQILSAKKSIGEFGFTGIFRDSEGNRVAFHSQPVP